MSTSYYIQLEEGIGEAAASTIGSTFDSRAVDSSRVDSRIVSRVD